MKKETFEKKLDTKIKVRVVSSRGHDEWEALPEVALSKIQTEVNTSKKWLYIDGVEHNVDNVTTDQLLEAEYIILTNALVGG